MPDGYKLCSFNCIYCHYGLTDVLTSHLGNYVRDLPDIDQVLDRVRKAMKSSLEFDYITFSGNGESTLHPDFGEIVKGVVDLRNKFRSDLKIALLSNSSGLRIEAVKHCIREIDLPIFKLDAGSLSTFTKINRPAGDISFDEIVGFLQQMKKIYIQTVLMKGCPSNVEDSELRSYFNKIAMIRPCEVQIYSLDRPVSNKEITRVLPEQLKKIAKYGKKETGVQFKVFHS
jgi:wyosine [tRNA(Phe)-imidazoG37] synthetase (radical SAM superfamily)